jgi:Na+/proline symporter
VCVCVTTDFQIFSNILSFKYDFIKKCFSSKSNNNRLTTTTRIVVDDVVVVVILLHAFWFDSVAINIYYIDHTTDYVSIVCVIIYLKISVYVVLFE